MNPKYKRMLAGMTLKEKAISRRHLKRDWLVYILRCKDGSFYTGVTNNMGSRLKMHNDGTGAHYTRVRCPVELIYYENGMTRSQVLTRECAIKAMSRLKKEDLIKTCSPDTKKITPNNNALSSPSSSLRAPKTLGKDCRLWYKI